VANGRVQSGVTIVMKHKGILAVCGAFALLACSGSPLVGERLQSKAYADGSKAAPAKSRPSRYSRHRAKRGPQVRGFFARGGYYSYVDPDVINTYGGTGTLWKSTSTFRDPLAERQSQGGPFDSGFFFDSGIGPRWNDSPYPR
jgi:hypothetical protein